MGLLLILSQGITRASLPNKPSTLRFLFTTNHLRGLRRSQYLITMKRLLIIIFCLGIWTAPAAAQVYYTPFFRTTTRNLSQIILENGIYKLPVQYESNTGHNATYILNVKIQNDKITCIYFDNGGSVHDGYNNSGYTWDGGGIKWDTDWNGNIQSGIAIIQVRYHDGGYQLFTIKF